MSSNNVSKDERLSRYLVSKSDFSKKNDIAKYGAFIPRMDNLILYVFMTLTLDENVIWEIGNRIAEQRKRNLHGRADIAAEKELEINLQINPDNNPPWHADIVDWPNDDTLIQLYTTKLAGQQN
ncbi:MAG: hypothetical protein A2161_05210 [Candidatus Schekmanbacteria bacterium RBG_13_48_7]|uniref:Uncharacterized protein n=1 Tax=Candidatus Schekmanbacteria bacterium RBG_13_48_7 TaxID=1817878 RepID=A0A1F7RLW3_9BACT|nr:MAG: hypothetical protein A2161_05210 [Candidatus Schekmanbacteria bacterium RBG_13_48_7]